MRQRLLELAFGGLAALHESVPVDLGVGHPVGEEPHRVPLLRDLVQVRAEVGTGCDDHVVLVLVSRTGLPVEGSHVVVVERWLLVALALDRPVAAVLRIEGD